MAVYTLLDRGELSSLLQPFGLGAVLHFEGITAGIENSNYRVTTAGAHGISREWVLTIFERQQASELSFHITLLERLARRGLPVPTPQRDEQGRALQQCRGKPALLMPRLPGSHPIEPTPAQCRAIGSALGALHRHTLDWGATHRGHRDLGQVLHQGQRLCRLLDNPDAKLMQGELEHFRRTIAPRDLPRAVIHGDLFRDNALFEGDRLTGVIDFFSAGTGYLMLDLAITANDWCSGSDLALEGVLAEALIGGYAHERAPAAAERRRWNDFLRVAALRFWITRLEDALAPQRGDPTAAVRLKDPGAFRELLLRRRDAPESWPPG